MKNQQDLITIIACSHVKSYGILLLNSTSSCPTNLSNCKVPSAQTKTTQQVGSKIMSSFMLAMFRILPLCFQHKEKLVLRYQSYNTPLLMMQINTMQQKIQLIRKAVSYTVYLFMKFNGKDFYTAPYIKYTYMNIRFPVPNTKSLGQKMYA